MSKVEVEVESVLIRLSQYLYWELVDNKEGKEVICNEFIQKYNLGKYKPGSLAFLTIKKSEKGLIHFRCIRDSWGSFWIWSDEPILKSYVNSNKDNTMHANLEDIIYKLSPKKQPFRADIYMTEIPFSCSGKESMAFINMK